ncbi:glycosyltransferase family 2 protein [Candidatus Chloroploca sp. Khr17]|uniref:glycosyltransferase family 2 protein n=1 Tax=Candidatus Chloroploca sp. Khr17 TaxID=2496869 RepID=UPI00101CA233|nr:glycosyltransferase family 2 protein [Candidatus Chloroploca sp. Khr17]
MPLHITAAICTHNRAALLPAAIESLLAQTLPPDAYEVLVIDNACTDETPQVIRRYLDAASNVTLRSAGQPHLGLSHARNLAVEMAAGEVIAFLDDDAAANPEWLAAILDAYAMHPEAWAVGGKVLPQWEHQRPDWLTDDLLPQLSMLDLGDVLRTLAIGEELYGANCSFRRRAFAELGLFRTDLGRQGAHLLGSEESELQQRIRQRGKCLMYTPHAVVYHRVIAKRLQPRYFVHLAHGKGRTRARLMLTDPSQRRNIAQHLTRGGLAVVRRWLLLGLHPFDKRRQLQSMRITAHWFGFVQEVIGEER